ncbi:amino acid adenylation domain-containing protein [Sorangium sp. So ce295]|uniref:amino acid adenylation domain-containing protein n=1 Tax=Sorangium sp. So ce295 TaxID=3133295 RepID=UPI003F5DC147
MSADPVRLKLLEHHWLRKLAPVIRRGAAVDPRHAPKAPRRAFAIAIPPDLFEAAQKACQGSELGLLVLLASALLATGRRSADGDSVTIGLAGFDELAPGPAADLLLLQRSMDPNTPFEELVQGVEQDFLEAMAHRELPFEALIGRLRERGEALDPDCFRIALGRSESPFVDAFDLDLHPAIAGGSAALRGSHGSSLRPFEAEAFVARVLHVLADGLRRPRTPIGQLRWFGPDEEARIRTVYNRSAVEPPFGAVHQLFGDRARLRPDVIAVVGEDGHLSYRALAARSSRLARALVQAGAGPEDVVAIFASYTTSLAVSTLGVLQAGAAFTLLDPRLPADRLELLLRDSGAAFLVIPPGTSPPRFGGRVLALDDRLGADAPPLAGTDVDPAQLAYLIYSSGSTGSPKATMVEHGAFSSFTRWAAGEYGHREGVRCLLGTSVAYDGTILQLFPPLAAGGTVLVVDPRFRLEIPRYVAYLRDQQIQCVDEVPSLLRELCAYLAGSGEAPLADLATLSVGGEAISIELVRECRRLIARTGIILNGYSPSETSPIVLTHRFDGARDDEVSLLGAPRPNARVLVLDADDEIVPPGVAGEIHIAGAPVSRGYRNQPGLTACRFVPSVWDDGGRMYRSGDRGRWAEGGAIEFFGRADRQVKVRGHRVELDEVEARLRALPEVAAAAVTLACEAPFAGQIVAHVALRGAPKAKEPPAELWPSLGEYLVYDELVYQAMTNDVERNRRYAAAIRRHVPGKVVVDVGTGKDAVLALMCVEAGARRVYAIETLDAAYRAARDLVASLGFGDRIHVIHGDSREVTLPEPADVCVSELLGGIGGCEGAAALLDDARRLLRPGAAMIPERCTTFIAAARLPDDLHEEPRFGALARPYVEAIFRRVGRRFDVPVGVRGYPPSLVASTPAVFEDLDFRGPIGASYERSIDMTVTEDGRIDGFVLWLSVATMEGEALDTLHHQHCWMPTFFPAFYPGVRVKAGDRITAVCSGRTAADGLLRDYQLRGQLLRRREAPVEFHHACQPYESAYRGSPFYERLFDSASVPAPARRGARAEASLRRRLAEQLPDFMVPARFVLLDALPMLESEKVDYLALPSPSLPDRAGESPAPRTAVERALAALWASVLGVGDVSVHDDFFRLGGHSLAATQLASRVRQTWGVEISVRDIFDGPTLGAQAGIIERALEARSAPAEAAPPPRRHVPRTGYSPLSLGQERLWFLSRFDPESPFYVAAAVVSLEGDLPIPTLRRALGLVAERHAILRTTFSFDGTRPAQVIAPSIEVPFEIVDYRDRPPEDARRALAEAQRERARRPFDLEAGPLWRTTLFLLEDRRQELLVTIHHILCDGWSVGVLTADLAAFYRQIARGEPPGLPELPLQYADYAVEQREAFEQGRFDGALAYWTRVLAGAPPLIGLPTDRPRPPVMRHDGATRRFRLSPAVAAALAALGEQEGASLFMVLLAAFKSLLHRYGAGTDLVVGFPIASRPRPELEGLIGFFASSMVLRTDLSHNPSFREVLRRVRSGALDAYAHQDAPFEKVVDAMRPDRDPSHPPLFQMAFVFHDRPLPPLDLPGLTAAVEELDTGTSKFDLTLTVQQAEDGLHGAMEYRLDLFDEGTIDRMIASFAALLSAAASTPDRDVRSLPLLSEAERVRALSVWNDTRSEPALRASLQQMFEAEVRRRPDAVAVAGRDECLTYRELNRRANRLARRLAALDVGPEVIVGVHVERSWWAAMALLAIVKRGAAFLVIDPTYPRERVQHILKDAAPAVLLAQPGLPDLPWASCPVLSLRDDGSSSADGATNPRDLSRPEGLAYVVYTSGTTGRPKGIAMTYASLANEIAWHHEASPTRGPLRTIQLASPSFDIAYLEVFGTLCQGGTLVTIPDDVRADPRALGEAMADLAVERAVMTYAMANHLTQAAQLHGLRLPHLRELASTGEELRITAEMRRFLQDHPRARLGNYYGPAECDVVTSCWMEGPPDAWPASAPIGRPIFNTRIYLVDGLMAPAPIGAPGDLLIGGACVGRGYLRAPAATAARFLPDPLSGEPGARLYHTGDSARYRTDGTIVFLGRTDRQIKLRGVRVEPAEIEVALSEHPGVEAAFVVALQPEGRDPFLVAYVVARPGSTVSVAELRAHVADRLPHFMRPRHHLFVPELPLDPNGKIDRRKLPSPALDAESAAAFAPPRSEVEAALASIWREVLGVDAVGRNDNFFDRGGDSLRIARAHARIVETLGVRLAIVDLFQCPTIAGLAELLAQRSPGASPARRREPADAEARRALRDQQADARRLREAGREGFSLGEARRKRGR